MGYDVVSDEVMGSLDFDVVDLFGGEMLDCGDAIPDGGSSVFRADCNALAHADIQYFYPLTGT